MSSRTILKERQDIFEITTDLGTYVYLFDGFSWTERRNEMNKGTHGAVFHLKQGDTLALDTPAGPVRLVYEGKAQKRGNRVTVRLTLPDGILARMVRRVGASSIAILKHDTRCPAADSGVLQECFCWVKALTNTKGE